MIGHYRTVIPPLYKNSYISFTTKHRKEDVVYPKFREHLGATLIVPWIDTDQLGTFSGEVERIGNALEVAEKKALLGMEATRLPFGLASEGSFGYHAYIPFLPSNQEIMMFIDSERGFKLHEIIVSDKTNFRHSCASNLKEAQEFLERCLFPSHAVIVRPNKCDDKSLICKGICNKNDFNQAFDKCARSSTDSLVWLETDMRANFNPTRMEVIGELAERLAIRLATICPACSAPGWGITKVEAGLPCEYCRLPTTMIAKQIFSCVLCDYTETRARGDGVTKAEQMYCIRCNP